MNSEQIECVKCEPEEIERLKYEIESRLPEIFSILAEAIKESGVSGNFDAEIKIDAVKLQSFHASDELASKTMLLPIEAPRFALAIEDQQVFRATGGWRKPCPDPRIAPDGCWMG